MNTLAMPINMEWVPISPGTYFMGGIDEDKFVTAVELPRHRVTIPNAFSIARHPVTNSQWSELIGIPSDGSPQAPVVGITWQEAHHFCRNLTLLTGEIHRLPSEAEWEYVCRAGTDTVFPGGNDLTPRQANYLYDELGHQVGIGHISEVGNYGANRFGVADLLGNVCEWTLDAWHPGFDGAPDHGGAWIHGGQAGKRVIRGGAWDHLPRVLRASWRDWAPESARWDNLGFRIVKEESP